MTGFRYRVRLDHDGDGWCASVHRVTVRDGADVAQTYVRSFVRSERAEALRAASEYVEADREASCDATDWIDL